MDYPIGTKPALWGFACGAAALAIAGFGWAGWTTGGKAEAAATMRADAAVVAALAPVCVERFRRAGDAAAKLAALKQIDTWSQAEFIEKGGWAIAGGSQADGRSSSVARACAVLLAAA